MVSIHNAATRPIRRARRRVEPAVRSRLPEAGALQVFLFRFEAFVGSELFGIEHPVTVGRHHQCQLSLEADTVSRHHCRLVQEKGRLYVEDLGSGNGTFINRKRVETRTEIRAGDTLYVGPYTLRVKLLRARSRAEESRRSTETTRIEAILSVEATGGDDELPVGIPCAFDQRLYEAALRRKTGREVPKPPSTPSTLPQDEMDEDSTMLPGAEVDEKLEPEMRARLRSLDQLIASLDALAPAGEDEDSTPSSPGARVIPLRNWRRSSSLSASIEAPITGPIEDTIPELMERPRHEARLLTPTSMRIPERRRMLEEEDPGYEDVWAAPFADEASTDHDHFDGVEIAARVAGRLVDIAVLRKASEHYVLGHRTPQGSIAPGKAHLGLRLLKINADRSVDLVFPSDVAGHLVRDGACVTLRELAEGRKYSCLRLEARDIATVILGQGENIIAYHVRFLRRPESLFRSLRRTLA